MPLRNRVDEPSSGNANERVRGVLDLSVFLAKIRDQRMPREAWPQRLSRRAAGELWRMFALDPQTS
jgi:hypothetical protein